MSLFEKDLAGCPRPDMPTMGALEPDCFVPLEPTMTIAGMFAGWGLAEWIAAILIWLACGALGGALFGWWARRNR